MSSLARKLADLIDSGGDVKQANLDHAVVDLTGYYTKTQVDSIITAFKGTATADFDTLGEIESEVTNSEIGIVNNAAAIIAAQDAIISNHPQEKQMPTLTDAVNTLVSNTTTLQTTVSGRITDMDGKISAANTAKVAAETAKAGAEVAKGLADTAKTDAETAQTLANNAKIAAESAQGVAATAKTDALTAKAATETAKGNAIAAQAVAENAKNLAQDWATKTTGAVDGGEYSAKYHATAASASASDAATTLSGRYTKAETDAKIVELSPPATKTHIDSLGINAATLTGSLPAISGANLTGIESAGRLLDMQTFTNDPGTSGASRTQRSSGGSFTWTKPAGCTKVMVYCTGAGSGSACNSTAYRTWGGAAGATAIGIFDVSAVSTVAVTTGSGSAGTTSTGTRPGTGGTSSFGSYCSASGGEGPKDGTGDRPYSGGIGGYAVGGTLNIPGGSGEGSHSANVEGLGGASYWFKPGGQHHNGTGQGDTDHSRIRTAGRYGSGAGGNYGSQYTVEWRYGGAGIVVVYAYSQENIMKALLNGDIVIEVAETEFEVHNSLVWVDCPDDCVAGEWCLIDGTLQLLPEVEDTSTYDVLRTYAYPSLQDQADMQFHDLANGTTTWLDAIQAVKDANPKP